MLWKACANNVKNNSLSFVDDPKVSELWKESNLYKYYDISVISMYNDFYGYNIEESKEVK